ncbi:Hypothetical predicted protein, partial [Mytilus galloprovincialis]
MLEMKNLIEPMCNEAYLLNNQTPDITQLKEYKPKEGDGAGNQNHGETATLETEETASGEERSAFFRAVRDPVRLKFVEAFEREKRDQRRIKMRQVKIKKQFEEFHNQAVGEKKCKSPNPTIQVTERN